MTTQFVSQVPWIVSSEHTRNVCVFIIVILDHRKEEVRIYDDSITPWGVTKTPIYTQNIRNNMEEMSHCWSHQRFTKKATPNKQIIQVKYELYKPRLKKANQFCLKYSWGIFVQDFFFLLNFFFSVQQCTQQGFILSKYLDFKSPCFHIRKQTIHC